MEHIDEFSAEDGVSCGRSGLANGELGSCFSSPELSETLEIGELIRDFEAQNRSLTVRGDDDVVSWGAVEVPLGLEYEFERLVRTYASLLYYIAFRILGDYEAARDVVQETWLQAYKVMISYSEERLHTLRVSSWLGTIARNIALNHLKYKSRRVSLDLAEGSSFLEIESRRGEQPEVVAIRRENTSEIRMLIKELPPKFSAVLERRVFLEGSDEWIARDLGLSISAVRVHALRGRALLRKMMQDKDRDIWDVEG